MTVERVRFRHGFGTYLHAFRATVVEWTAAGWVGRTGNISFKTDALLYIRRVFFGDSRKKRAGVWMQRMSVDCLGITGFYNMPEIHDADFR